VASMMVVHYDAEAEATYVELSDAPWSRTVELIDAYLLVDLDDSGVPVGVEVLDAPADIQERV
jgi:uncharacterized protein YuzE